MTLFLDIPGQIWWVFLEAAPYVVLGLLAAVLVHTLFSKERIQKSLGHPGLRSIVKSALFGIPLPLCSCGVLPTALSLRDRGASRGATVSFLVSTPETGVDSIAITYALINPLMTVLRPISAFVTAVIAGLGAERFGTDVAKPAGHHCACGCEDTAAEEAQPFETRVRKSAKYVATDFFPDIANWLLLGLVISGIAAALIPNDFLTRVPASAQLLLAVAAGIPIYICASASTPIAAVLMMKGVSPGAALVFLLVGPATNLASLLVVGRRMGARTALWYLISLVVTSLAIGWIVNATLGHLDWTPRIADPAMHEHFTLWNYIGAAILSAGFVYVWVGQLRARMRQGRTGEVQRSSESVPVRDNAQIRVH
ncbi:MAG: SO_0444 family Cu/Zn efflux transporter [Candidatus Zixiibacteriota bacterium]